MFSRPAVRLGAILSALAVSGAAAQQASNTSGPNVRARFIPYNITVDDAGQLSTGDRTAGTRGACPQTEANYTAFDFLGGGLFAGQGGFVEDETAAVTYTVPSDEFPLRLDLAEILFVTVGTSVTTTTIWSVQVWEGTPATGTQIFSIASDGALLPHLVMGPGNNGTVIQFGIDPGDPEQIFINNNGTNQFSIGFTVEQHNNQTADGCTTMPSQSSNAFPATDTDGLSQQFNNWIGVIACPFSPAGFLRFSEIPITNRPSGDWVMRALYTPTNCTSAQGACCFIDGTCFDGLTASECTTLNGTAQGDGTTCAAANCPLPTGACCLPNGSCLDVDEPTCMTVGGTHLGDGSACLAGNVCPQGACCLPDGSCVDGVTAIGCADLGGLYEGDLTDCASTSCPQPTGACCLSNGNCIIFTESDCGIVSGTWAGAATTCPDACVAACLCEFGGDPMLINVEDLLSFLGLWFPALPEADINGGGVDVTDLLDFLGCWFPSSNGAPCP